MTSFSTRSRLPSQTPRRQHGVSLIELMVSLVIGLLLILGAVTVYTQSRNTYRTDEAAARLQETARYVFDMIEPDVRLAGYFGLTNRPDFVENRGAVGDAQQAVASGVTNNCQNNWTVDVARFLDGRDNGSYGLTGCAAVNNATWSDTLIVRRASSTTSPLTNNRFQIQTNRMRGVIFKNGTLPAGFGIAPASETHDLVVRAYYISNPAAGQFALRRKTLNGLTVADEQVIQGVEDLQVQFGVDTTGDSNADRYVDAGGVPAGAQIVSARIWVMVTATDIEVGFQDGTTYAYANVNRGTYSDQRRRLVVAKTIQIRNSGL